MAVMEKTKRAAMRDDVQPHPGRRMTEAEFVDWVGEKTRAEWVDGEVIMMSPVSSEHDDLGFWLRCVTQDFVEYHDLGKVKGPEFMVRLPRVRRRRVPDLLFVAKGREGIIRSNHVEGPPDLIIELVSPESVVRDWRDKYHDYARGGVREYLAIDRRSERVEMYALAAPGKYRRVDEVDGKLISTVLEGFYLRPKWLLAARLPSRRSVLRELRVKG